MGGAFVFVVGQQLLLSSKPGQVEHGDHAIGGRCRNNISLQVTP